MIAKWMKAGVAVTVNGSQGEIYKVTDKVLVRLNGETHADAYDPAVIKKLTKASQRTEDLPPVYSLSAVKDMNYEEVPLAKEYIDLMGDIDPRAVMMAYGPSGSGKSVWVMKFADHFADTIGKAFYNSHEEGKNKSIKLRAHAHNIGGKNVFIAPRYSFRHMMMKLKTSYYRMIVIDSVQFMRFTFEQLEELMTYLKKRKVIILMVSFGKSLGVTRGADDLLHTCDVKLFFEQGKVTCISRYLDEPREQVLFTPKKSKKAGQTSLF